VVHPELLSEITSRPIASEDGIDRPSVALSIQRSQTTACAPIHALFHLARVYSAHQPLQHPSSHTLGSCIASYSV
jgi:hypothetical protein